MGRINAGDISIRTGKTDIDLNLTASEIITSA